jgi:hypothetical protein
VKHDIFDDSDKGGTPQYMVNVYTPQFNLQPEESNVSYCGNNTGFFCSHLVNFNYELVCYVLVIKNNTM